MRKDDLRSVRRPGRPGVALMSRQLDLMRAVWKDRVELRRGAIGEGAEGLEENPLAIRRPMLKPRLQFSPRCQLLQTGAITVDDEQRLIVIRIIGLVVAHKEYLLAIGRPGGKVISNTRRERGFCELQGMAAIGIHDPEPLIRRVAVGTNRIIRNTIDNLATIRRPFAYGYAVTHSCAVGELLEARSVSVHHKDLAGAMCRHKREEDFGAVGRPIRVSVLVSRVRMRELPYISPISLCREDSGSALVVIQKALPGDLPVRACGDGVLSGCGSRRRGLLAWCGLPTGRQECRQQTDQQNGIHTSSHRCFSFLSFCRLLKRADEDSLGSAQENWRTRISVSANKGPSKFGCW